MRQLRDIKGTASFLVALPGFLREPLTSEEAIRRLEQRREPREESFFRLLSAGVFENPQSPYRALFRNAGIEHEDVLRLVREDGLDAALRRLYGEGIRLTIEELRARVPLRRGSFELPTRREDFENPLVKRQYELRTGASRSKGMPVSFNVARSEDEAGYRALLLKAFGVPSPAVALWYPAPPGVAGLSSLLGHSKLGLRIERWFSQTDPGWREARNHVLFTRATILTSRLAGRPLPAPEHTPPQRADRVARWIVDAKQRGHATAVFGTPSSAVRVCLAAREFGLDISGTLFRLGGEPYTPSRAEVVEQAGCRAASSYYIAEIGGSIGLACAAPEEVDEVHVLTDKWAVIQYEKRLGDSTVGALAYTTLNRRCPRVLINLESDDYGVLGERECGCLFGEAGLSLHLHGIRSYEKLTSEGMHFLGSDVITLLERVLPARFGGSPMDYQLVEQEEHGLSRVGIVVSPRLGDVDEAEVVDAAISFFRAHSPGYAMMFEVWRQSGTLRVLRREPYVTPGAKLPALHRLRADRAA